jgi:hypothetical protein
MDKDPLIDGEFTESGRFVTGTSQILTNIHKLEARCLKEGCVVHKPSDHHMRHMRTIWRNDRAFMERICEHGVGHPDPDQVKYWKTTLPEEEARAQAVHGCDGCCVKP